MLALEALQMCPTQQSAILNAIGVVYLKNTEIIMFYTIHVKLFLPHHISFQIKVAYQEKSPFRMIVDEGALICVIDMSCWTLYGYPKLVPSPTILVPFDDHSHRSHGIIVDFLVRLGGKNLKFKVEVVNEKLYYNLLLRCTLFYAMQEIVSTPFHILYFPHEWKIIMINHIPYCHLKCFIKFHCPFS